MRKIGLLFASILLSCAFAWGCNKYEPPATPELPNPPQTEGSGNDEPTPELPALPDVPVVPETPSQPDQSVDTETPTKPSPPVIQYDVLLASKVDSLSVRSGKGTSYSVLGTLDKGDMVDFIALEGNWYKTVYRNRTAYVSASYVEKRSFAKGSAAIEKVIAEGKKLLGIPYVLGAQRYHWGNGVLNTAFDGKTYDCSSLVQYVFKRGANVNLKCTSREQSLQGEAVSELRRGDLLFFTNDARKNKTGIERIGHVAIALGDNKILHTASDHAVIEDISAKRWSYFITARRVIA